MTVLPLPPASLQSSLLRPRRCSRKKSVGPLTTGTVMCNYSMTPGCTNANPPPPSPPRCVSASPLPMTSTHTHIHTHLVNHTTLIPVPVGGFRVVRITEACWEQDVEPDSPVDLCQQGLPVVSEILDYQGLLKDSRRKVRNLDKFASEIRLFCSVLTP